MDKVIESFEESFVQASENNKRLKTNELSVQSNLYNCENDSVDMINE
jgi:hypothetical protein